MLQQQSCYRGADGEFHSADPASGLAPSAVSTELTGYSMQWPNMPLLFTHYKQGPCDAEDVLK